MTTNYGYDSTYQFLSATQSGNTTETYTYDPVGNRLSSLGVASYTNNTSNELTATSNATYGYDLNGNVTTKNNSSGLSTYAWDFENRLTSVTLPGTGGTVSFKYDPFGRRIYKSSSSGASVFAYDGNNLIEETNATGAVVARYSQGLNIDEPLAMLRSSATSFYHADGLGSITSLSNAAGALAQTYTFDSFGKQTASTGALTNPFQYTGRESDSETGLYYYRARYYDPAVGRFLSEDRLRSVSGTLDFYGYVENSVPNLADASGLCPSSPSGDKSKCPGQPDRRLRLVPISDCSHKGQRRIVYDLEGPDASCWWVTEHVEPKWWVPAAPAMHSPQGQSTGDYAGSFDDGLYGWDIGPSVQTFTISPQDPRVFPNTQSFPVIVQLPSGPNGQPQDFGALGQYHGGIKKLHCTNGNCTGWVPCLKGYDVPGF